MTVQKRKGESVFEDRTNAHVVVVDPGASKADGGNPMDSIRETLKQFRLQQIEEEKSPDSILEAFMSIGSKDQEKLDSIAMESNRIQDDLDSKIEEATKSCQHETSVLAQLTAQTGLLEQTRDKLMREIDEIDQRQVVLQQQIALHQQEASEEIEFIDTVEEERKRQVPRLKTQISLYASTTGIKWDFDKEEVLSGSVTIPSQQGMKLFSIDPRDHSPVDTAKKLWDMMEGKE